MRGYFYRLVMKLSHKFNWHHMKVCHPDGDTLLWCHWCGARCVIARRNRSGEKLKKAEGSKA
jgi:hypothetical protein